MLNVWTSNRRLGLPVTILRVVAISLPILWSFFGGHVGAQNLAITGAHIIPIVGNPIEDGTIVIRDGKIVAIGTDVKIPVEAMVINATGKVVLPGFVEAHSSDGMSQANENNPNVPYVSVLDSIDPMRTYFDEARRNGVTTVAVISGNTTMIGGQGSVIKTGAPFLDDMILQRVAGMKISLSPVSGLSRMGHLAALRKELTDAHKLANPQSAEKVASKTIDEKAKETEQVRRGRRERPDAETPKEDSPNGEGDKPAENGDSPQEDQPKSEPESKNDEKPKVEPIDELKQPLVDLVTGKMIAFIHCETPIDVNNALSLIDEFNLDPILVLDRSCYKVAAEVVASGFPIILDSDLVFWERDPRTNEDSKVVLIDAFREVSSPIAFSVARSNSDTLGSNYLWYQAAVAVKYGMPKQQALEALTIGPAKMLGVDGFIGSLEKGKDGDLLILSGDPLSVDTWVDMTIIDGKVVYDRSDDPKLELLLEGTK